VEPQSFLFADCATQTGALAAAAGLMVYDLMAGQRSHDRADLDFRMYALAPGLAIHPAQLRGALVFHGRQDRRRTAGLRVLQEAQRDGATLLKLRGRAANLRDGERQVSGVTLQDALRRATITVRARGGQRHRRLGRPAARRSTAPSPCCARCAAATWCCPSGVCRWRKASASCTRRDGRPVFFYPWEGATLSAPPTWTTRDLNVEASISRAEVDYLIEAVNDQFPARS
jgi:glycerol-3-phosphate dehydrogenase